MGVSKYFLCPFCLMSEEQFPVYEAWMGFDHRLVMFVHGTVDVFVGQDVDSCWEAG